MTKLFKLKTKQKQPEGCALDGLTVSLLGPPGVADVQVCSMYSPDVLHRCVLASVCCGVCFQEAFSC